MNDRPLCLAILALRQAAPAEWRKFLEEYEAIALKAEQDLQGSALGLTRERFDTFLDNRGWVRNALFNLRSFKDPESRLREPKKPAAETTPT